MKSPVPRGGLHHHHAGHRRGAGAAGEHADARPHACRARSRTHAAGRVSSFARAVRVALRRPHSRLASVHRLCASGGFQRLRPAPQRVLGCLPRVSSRGVRPRVRGAASLRGTLPGNPCRIFCPDLPRPCHQTRCSDSAWRKMPVPSSSSCTVRRTAPPTSSDRSSRTRCSPRRPGRARAVLPAARRCREPRRWGRCFLPRCRLSSSLALAVSLRSASSARLLPGHAAAALAALPGDRGLFTALLAGSLGAAGSPVRAAAEIASAVVQWFSPFYYAALCAQRLGRGQCAALRRTGLALLGALTGARPRRLPSAHPAARGCARESGVMRPRSAAAPGPALLCARWSRRAGARRAAHLFPRLPSTGAATPPPSRCRPPRRSTSLRRDGQSPLRAQDARVLVAHHRGMEDGHGSLNQPFTGILELRGPRGSLRTVCSGRRPPGSASRPLPARSGRS